MNHPADERILALQGHLNMETVPAWLATGLQRLSGEDMTVDFSRVDSVDSAAVGMLLGWARAAQRSKHELRVAAVPENLLSLARLYGVDDLLPQQSV